MGSGATFETREEEEQKSSGMTGSVNARLRKRSVRIAGHLTSVSMEEVFWNALREIASKREISVNALVTEIDRTRDGNLSSALRVYVFENTRNI